MGWDGMDFGRYWTSTTGVGDCTRYPGVLVLDTALGTLGYWCWILHWVGYPGLLVSPRSKDCSHPNLSPRHLRTFVTYSPGAALQISHFEPPQPPKCNGYCKTRTLCSQVIKGAPAQSSSDIHFWNTFLLNTPTCVHVHMTSSQINDTFLFQRVIKILKAGKDVVKIGEITVSVQKLGLKQGFLGHKSGSSHFRVAWDPLF